MHNTVILTGRLTADPELRQTSSGTHVCNVNIAVDRPYHSNQTEFTSDFFRIEIWNGSADFVARTFSKGQLIEVVGMLRSRRWTDKNDITHYETYVKAADINFAPINNSKKTSAVNNDDDFMNNFIPIEIDMQ